MAENNLPINGVPEVAQTSTPELKLYTFSDLSYDTGFADGALQLENMPHYEVFSSHLEKKQLAEDLLARCRVLISEAKSELAFIKKHTAEIYSVVFDREEKIRVAVERLDEFKQKRQDYASAIQTIEADRRQIKPENSWVAATIVLLSGFAFILADVLITEEIMEDVLSMKPFEAWIIAISISLTVFGVKPLIDRVFERPRWENNKILRNNILLIVTGLFVLIMLALLGYLRVKGYELLLRDSSSEEGVNTEEWGKIFSDPSLFGIFIFASMLFAVVGALCLSIGFRSVEQHIERWKMAISVRNLRRDILFQENRLFELQEVVTRYRKELRESQKELELLPSKAKLEIDLARLQSEEKDLMALIAEANATAQSAWYREGAARGAQFNISGELYVSPIRTERWVVPEPVQGRAPRVSTKPTKTEVGPLVRADDYLYQQIRNAIASNDNKSNKNSYNGK